MASLPVAMLDNLPWTIRGDAKAIEETPGPTDDEIALL
jgi:hypothetical protein